MADSAFQKHWTIEVIRQREVHWGPCADSRALNKARQQAGFADKIYTRALSLAEEHELIQPMQFFSTLKTLLLSLLILFAVFAGISLGNTVLTRSDTAISLLDALIILLSLNFLTLLIWCISMLTSSNTTQGVGGILFRLANGLVRSSRLSAVSQAFISLCHRQQLLKPGFSSISHAFWAVLLGSALLILWLRFIGQEYQFTWQTTLLSESAVNQLIQILNTLPALFNIEAPSAELLRTQQSFELHRQSATWLLACLALYGLLPRLILLSASESIRHLRKRRLELDHQLPGIAELKARLSYEPAQVVDPAPRNIPAPAGRQKLAQHSGGQALLLALEHEIPSIKDLPDHVGNLGMIASGAQRQELIQKLTAGNVKKVLVVVDARLSPDRGSIRFIAEISSYCPTAIWLNHSQLRPERSQSWSEQLQQRLQLEVYSQEQQALHWVTNGGDTHATT
ncbi:hypothetical protein CWE09_00335 [Aliidiomarina minuta]|uniref:DUF2868 domain-containing protein n=1 Tax=Aliidiomarina minuta TaxID=880057 RepID=A0A432W5G2_9GAMM|nr:DUF2868 domain-containing protein [Aliidiomarina minuta]RUO25226.1 hypothetical protein CWE09_00335 [Aliidiomarina minuta]